jgi:hypothetical protein
MLVLSNKESRSKLVLTNNSEDTHATGVIIPKVVMTRLLYRFLHGKKNKKGVQDDENSSSAVCAFSYSMLFVRAL